MRRESEPVRARVRVFPKILALPDQGMFAIGYCHQRENFFQKRPTETGGEAEQ